MKRFTSLEELRQDPLYGGIFGAVQRAVRTEQEIAHPEPYDPENGSVWLLQSTDTDATLIATFGVPFIEMSFEQVAYHPEEEHFVCYRVVNNSRCDTLVIPDLHWLADEWRNWLLAQL